jgi:hypothetical protein
VCTIYYRQQEFKILIDTECSTAMRSLMMYILHQILSDHQIKEDGISLACSTHGKEEKLYKVLFRKLQEKRQPGQTRHR